MPDSREMIAHKTYAASTASLMASLVAPFKQRGIVKSAIQEVAYGMCLGISVEWIVRHKAYKSEGPQLRVKYIGTDSTAGPGLASLKAQLAYKDAPNEAWDTGQPDSINAAFSKCGSKMTATKTGVVNHVHADPDAAFAALFAHTSGAHNYYIIILRFDNGKDLHATAAYRSGGKIFGLGAHIYFFDPNFGEFKVGAGASDIKAFFVALAAAYMLRTDSVGQPGGVKLTQIVVDRIAVV